MPFTGGGAGRAVAIASGTSFPANPDEGDVFYRTDENAFFVYDGTDWVRWEIETHESEHEAGGADALPIASQPQPDDDQKIYFGTDDDYSIRYDSTDDTYYIRDEVNATEVEIPKNVAMNIAAHEARHESGGADEIPAGGLVAGADPRSSSHEARHESGGADAIPAGSLNAQDPTAHAASHAAGGADELYDQSLNTTDNVQFAQVTVADLVMENDWRFTEHPDHGVVLKSPEGRIFKLIVEELK